MTLKDILDDVMLESGLGTEVAYASSSRDEIKRLLSVANRATRYLLRLHDWQVLRKTYTFSLSTDTSYPLPTDFSSLVPDTAFADGSIDTVDMATDPGLWGYLQASTGAAGPRYRLRIIGDTIRVFDPDSGELVRFEYMSNTPIRSATGEAKQRFTADTDTCLLDDDAVVQETLWRYQRLIGLPGWQDVRAEAQAYLRTLRGQESSVKSIGGDEFRHDEPFTPLWVNNV